MKIKRGIYCIISTALACLLLFLLISSLKTNVATAQNLPQDPISIIAQGPNDPLKVSPDPPQANEPTELRIVYHNQGDNPVTRYAQFYWGYFSLGMPRTPILAPIEFVLPAHTEGGPAITWVPPEANTYSFYVDIFDAPGATEPVDSFSHNVVYRGLPNPETPYFIEDVPIVIGNPLPEEADVALNLIVPIDATGWEARIYPPLATLNLGEVMIAHSIFTYTGGGGLPPDGMITFLINGTLNGMPMAEEGQVIFGPPLRLHMRPEPPYAQSEISVNPYPVSPGEPTEICVEVRNVTPQPREGMVTFRVAPFGIGLPFQPISPPIPILIPQLGIQRPCIFWVPPYGGQFAFDVQVEAADFPMPMGSQRVVDMSGGPSPGTTSTFAFTVANSFNQPLTITLGLRPFIPEWSYQLSLDELRNIPPGGLRQITLNISIPADSPMPPDGSPVVDVEAFAGLDLIGGWRKVYRPPIPIHQPGDPIYAESEITVNPYPPQEREPTEICAALRNPSQEEQTVNVDFNVSNFGIGLPFHMIRSPITVTLPAFSVVKTCTNWVPPFGGRFGVEVGIQLDGYERIYSQRFIDVGEILLPNQLTVFEFPIGNPYNFPITVTLGANRFLPQWEVAFDPPIVELPPGAIIPVGMHVLPVQQLGDPEPREGEPVIDVEAYWSGNGQNGLLGGFRKLFTPPVPIHNLADPPFAEGEIHTFPYPPQAGEPTRLEFEARNPTPATQQISVTFEVSYFGIGLPFQPIALRMINLPPDSTGMVDVTWVPPFAGEFCVRVKVEAAFFAEPFYSSRNISIVRLPQPYGLPEAFTFAIGDNGIYTRPLTVTLGLREYLPDWHVELGTNEIVFPPGQSIATAVMTITPPVNPAELPMDGGPVADVSAYVNGKLIGGIRKIWRPPVPLGDPQEPSYAESEIVINPDPPVAGQIATFAAQVRNNSDYTQTIKIQFGWADFGFGIPFTTTNVVPTQTMIILSPNLTTTVRADWIPPYSGNICVEIILTNEQTGEELHSQRNVEVIEVLETQCDPIIKEFLLVNSTAQTITVTLGAGTINLPPGWEYSFTPTEAVLSPFESITATVVITPPCDLNAQGYLQPLSALDVNDTSNPAKIQIEGFDQNGALVGGVELQVVRVAYQPTYLPFLIHSSAGAEVNDLPEAVHHMAQLLSSDWTKYFYWSVILLAGAAGMAKIGRNNG